MPLTPAAPLALAPLALALCGAADPPARPAPASLAPDRPNVVLIVADDLGWGECGFQHGPGSRGEGAVPTPHLDALAAAGVRFSRGYVTASYCSPSRAGLLTGRLQTRFGHELNPVGARNELAAAGLPVGVRTLADALRGEGYATALLGKWHLGGHPTAHPLRRGFDEFFGFLHEGHFYSPAPPGRDLVSFLRRKTLPDGRTAGVWADPGGRLFLNADAPIAEPAYDANNPVLRGGRPEASEQYFTDRLTAEAGDYVARHAGRPFFLCVSYSAVHSPMQATRADYDAFPDIADPHRRVFAGMLKSLDDGVGAIRESLEKWGLEENTLVLFLSDNGGPTAELTSTNAPLRGGKGSLYEGGIRVPMLAAWPGVLPAGETVGTPVTALDFAATALAAAGGDVPEGWDGVDLRPALSGAASDRPREPFYWRMGGKAALLAGDLKLVRPSADAAWELYDLAADPAESRDLAADRPEELHRLVAAWETRDAAMVAPNWSRR